MPSRRSTRASRSRTCIALIGLALVAAPAAASAAAGQGTHWWQQPADQNKWSIEIISSAPSQVSGGDALVRVGFPGSGIKKNARLLLNGVDVTSSLAPHGGDLLGVVSGFALGENLLELKSSGLANSTKAQLVAINHPQSGPIFSGPQQQPFVCTTARVGLGQPIIDNQDHFGIPVAQEDATGNYPRDGRGYPTSAATIIGWSKDCAANTSVTYQYRRTNNTFAPLADPAGPLPSDIATTTTLDGQTVPYIVRWERGTINRFVYSIAMLVPTTDSPSALDDSLWNGRLVFSLEGGVAIGRTQGTSGGGATLRHDVLRLGYAVLASTGLRTNTHYNLQLAGETALMLKEHFVEDHGVPLYTVGVGGSGGAIQQYAFAQNHPGLIDAAIPQYSYSDMITQAIHVGDCELLEYYFDATDRTNLKWRDPEMRQAIMGLNATDFPKNLSSGEIGQWNLLYSLYPLFGYPVQNRDPASPVPGLTECRAAWFGLTPLVLNPTFTNVQDLDKLAQGFAGVDWTHAGDLVNIYGNDEDGYGRNPWDNVGVQYGLRALQDGVITPAEFLDLNAKVGSWKDPADMVAEGFPFVVTGSPTPATFDPWSSRNMNLSPGGTTPAPRRTGNLDAIHAAYESGMRFDGDIDIPVIDWRHYLEHELDMHHSHQSFATRRRLALARGNADNQVIWFTDARPAVGFDQTPEAFAVIDEWMANLRANPWLGVAGSKPSGAVDRCFNTSGAQIAAGDHVWDGILDANPPGACTQQFQTYSSTRRVAGGPFEGGIFKCGRKSVDAAIADGDYGSWVPSAAEKARLEQIFPEGVCDWSQPDEGRP